jgi:putative transposase
MKYKRDLAALEQRRLKGARLLNKGVSQAEVARRCGVSRQTASAWERTLKEKGAEGMKRRPLGRPRQLSDVQRAELSKMLLQGALAQGFPTELWTLPRVAKLVREHFGIRYSVGHMWHLLRGLGFSCQKPARRATQRDEAGIERWKKRRWPALKKTPQPEGKPSSS